MSKQPTKRIFSGPSWPLSTPCPSPSRTAKSRPQTNQSRKNTGHRRLWTTQSRPNTARPVTAVSTRHEGSYVIALFEGRGVAREVGMAALDKDTGKVVMVQLTDCPTYVKTLHQMNLHSPCLIIVPDTFLSSIDASFGSTGGGSRTNSNSLLIEYIQEEFPRIQIDPVGRRYWNEAAGLEFINQLCVEDDERAATVVAVSNKYYALSAASALFKHAEAKLNTRFASGSLRIRYAAVEGTMMIDTDTARNLELVGNMASNKSTHSLFGILNYTYTAMASRLLRVNLLAPLTSQTAIDARLDVVEELVQTEDMFAAIRAALKAMNKLDFDKLIVSLASSETRVTNIAKPSSARVTQMLNLRNLLRSIPLLRAALSGSRSQLLQVIHAMLSDERLAKIEGLVCDSLNEESAPSKGGISAVNSRVYAVKASRNRLLDVARETYKENVADIHQLSRSLSDAHGGLSLALVWQDTGFVLTLKKSDLEGELPKGFINTVLKKGKWHFTTMDLKKLNARMKDALDEALILSDKVIQDLVADIVLDIGALYKASEAVSLVDMLWSFANASINRNYVRPEFTDTLAIKSGRHPILETINSAGSLVPNDVYADDSSMFQLVQGPNMSGKSTYLRQIGLLAVMAMSGCFVPAEYASFRVHDALLSRLSNEDDMAKGLSTFSSEMATSAMILGMSTTRSLVLIDELGRGTSPTEGLGMSHAIAEGLIETKCFVYFTTHFGELATTLSPKPNLVNLHLSVQRSRPSAASFGMTYQYKIVDGTAEDLGHYGHALGFQQCVKLTIPNYVGLEIARLADLPEDVHIKAKEVSDRLTMLDTRQNEDSRSNKILLRRKALLTLRTQLAQAFKHSALHDEDLVRYLSRIQKEVAKVFLETE
ncbi:hypothetical protein HGRIS_007304 [Hohenbuehelia grisea]|uniref:DNA mismatch repair proteins mutS family domain-containing protein n=1 Tax=Hohenbuehelia grisea TaxID=104357 RepID=A0ABR3J4C5_9AGAR